MESTQEVLPFELLNDLRIRCNAHDGVDAFTHVEDFSRLANPGGGVSRYWIRDEGRIVGLAVTKREGDGALAVDPQWRRRGIATSLLEQVESGASGTGEEETRNLIKCWVPGSSETQDAVDRLAYRRGYCSTRRMLQLKVKVAVGADHSTGLPPQHVVRPFREQDLDAMVALNNEAFSWHPDRSNLTTGEMRRQMAPESFSPDDLLVLWDLGRSDEPVADETLVGFCWTKIHPANEIHESAVGEIYVVCVSPRYQGQGLGQILTRLGMGHMSSEVPSIMLFVEDNNLRARATYLALGFELAHVHNLYERSARAQDDGRGT